MRSYTAHTYHSYHTNIDHISQGLVNVPMFHITQVARGLKISNRYLKYISKNTGYYNINWVLYFQHIHYIPNRYFVNIYWDFQNPQKGTSQRSPGIAVDQLMASL